MRLYNAPSTTTGGRVRNSRLPGKALEPRRGLASSTAQVGLQWTPCPRAGRCDPRSPRGFCPLGTLRLRRNGWAERHGDRRADAIEASPPEQGHRSIQRSLPPHPNSATTTPTAVGILAPLVAILISVSVSAIPFPTKTATLRVATLSILMTGENH